MTIAFGPYGRRPKGLRTIYSNLRDSILFAVSFIEHKWSHEFPYQ